MNETNRRTEDTLREHIDQRFDDLERLIRSGFPNGDPVQHRQVHEGYINEAAARAALRKAIFEKILSGSVMAGLGLLALAAWEFLKREIAK